MGIYLGQMPPAEMARLKAEIAETLIANFSYPRYFDYRMNALRMRPVDRTKRQEVWTFLSAFDFNAFSRIDVMSPDFQRQVERLLIQFVQRNRAFFGQQGRKRMSDVRALITSSSTSVTEGLRGHLNRRASTQSLFGHARPVVSWSKGQTTGRLELSWDQIVNATMLLQQQLQEVRGEVKSGANGDVRAAAPGASSALNGASTNGATAAPPRRSPRVRPTVQGQSNAAPATVTPLPMHPLPPVPLAPPVMPGMPASQDQHATQAANPSSGPLAPGASGPLSPSAAPAAPLSSMPNGASVAQPVHPSALPDQRVLHATTPGNPLTTPPVRDEKAPAARQDNPVEQALSPMLPVDAQPALPTTGTPPRELARTEPQSQPVANRPDSATIMLSDEDVMIFEQLRQQLIVWLRIEAVRADVDLTGQSPAQLIEVLGQQDSVDETRLQIVSTLLGLANQVIANGYATLVEYKQAMMFYLIHTRRVR